MLREQEWRAGPWSDQGLGKQRGKALVSQGFCCGLALLPSLPGPASENQQMHQSENTCRKLLKTVQNELLKIHSTFGFCVFSEGDHITPSK